MPPMPPPPIQPQPALPIPLHDDVFYGGAAQPQQHHYQFPQQQQQHHLSCKLQKMLMQGDIEIVEDVMHMLLLHLLPPSLNLLLLNKM
ncbi:hypothetical protein PAXRUDRAFT_19491 [Paxillus rubicundulus Ve08.2h10]|uniref:Uncharacterized protein n=1 Tax=Paxillus rubicundulus Ve08.2h10 TaxID=930991 RepID=A0A0D0BTS6_9AGAM|nr:hypothetical protein PAXRUDRAFT_19491 [Paxillus rubicundulus Ve08.2h10]